MLFDEFDKDRKRITLILEADDVNDLALATNEAAIRLRQNIEEVNGHKGAMIADEATLHRLEMLTCLFMLGWAALQQSRPEGNDIEGQVR